MKAKLTYSFDASMTNSCVVRCEVDGPSATFICIGKTYDEAKADAMKRLEELKQNSLRDSAPPPAEEITL